jgi:hypothetical protein
VKRYNVTFAAMGWFHGHKRWGALLAFAALALQIVVSLGHVHLDGVRPHGTRITLNAPHHAVLAQAPRPAPAQNPGDDDDYCAVCASIYLAATTFISHAPSLPVPPGSQRIVHSYASAHGSFAPHRVAFRSRAPPAT